MTEYVTWLQSFSFRQSKLNLLLIFLPLSVYFEYQHNLSLAFFCSLIAIMPLAFLMGRATEEIALRTSESVGGLLNATFGNAAEMIIAIFAIIAASNADLATPEGILTQSTMINLVQASLIGSILGNLLLIMGLSFVWGGIHHSEQTFSTNASRSNGSLLLLSMLVLIVPSVYSYSVEGERGIDGLSNLSHIASLILISIYFLFLLFQLKTHVHLFATEGAHFEESEMSQRDSIILLILSTVLVSWMAHILVHSVEVAADEFDLPYLFIGVILLPFFGNAAEHFTAVVVAGKNKMELSFAISMGSSTQIAVFVAPFMVLISWFLNVPLTFEFGLLETISVFLSVLIVNSIAEDGRSNWLEGAMLLGAYTILGAAFLFYH
ncbi:MAG: calcium/proton exchanger [Euryarchaeota archaeon]|nr:calcium/proton exchanger [Euryarchaeota archaeon]